jgi:hypothetical protein
MLLLSAFSFYGQMDRSMTKCEHPEKNCLPRRGIAKAVLAAPQSDEGGRPSREPMPCLFYKIKNLEKIRDHPSFRTVSCILHCCDVVKTKKNCNALKDNNLLKNALAEPCWEPKNI